jgi:hypothetical protein
MSNHSDLGFAEKVTKRFAFLLQDGFSEAEVLPTLVRYRNGYVEIDIYHGQQSFEVGSGVLLGGIRYSISEVIRSYDEAAANAYRYMAATTESGVVDSLEELARLMRKYVVPALQDYSALTIALEAQRKEWANQYSLDVLEHQLRPQAEDAFRRGDYSKAIELYRRLSERLSPVEVKKLALAEKRVRNAGTS